MLEFAASKELESLLRPMNVVENRALRQLAPLAQGMGRWWTARLELMGGIPTPGTAPLLERCERILRQLMGATVEVAQESVAELALGAHFAFQPEDFMPAQGLAWYEASMPNLVKGLAQDQYQQVQALVRRGTLEGWGDKELSGHISEGVAQLSKTRLENIARTESMHVYNAERLATMEQSEDVVGYRYDVLLDSRTSAICRAFAGQYVEKAELRYSPPFHFFCRTILRPVFAWQRKPRQRLDSATAPMDGFGERWHDLLRKRNAGGGGGGTGGAGGAAGKPYRDGKPGWYKRCSEEQQRVLHEWIRDSSPFSVAEQAVQAGVAVAVADRAKLELLHATLQEHTPDYSGRLYRGLNIPQEGYSEFGQLTEGKLLPLMWHQSASMESGAAYWYARGGGRPVVLVLEDAWGYDIREAEAALESVGSIPGAEWQQEVIMPPTGYVVERIEHRNRMPIAKSAGDTGHETELLENVLVLVLRRKS